MKKKLFSALFLLTLTIFCFSEVSSRDLISENLNVKPDGASSVHASFSMGAGKITLSGGATGLMDACFKYDIESLKPIINYQVKSQKGELKVEQPENSRSFNTDNTKYEWKIKLNERMPLDMTLKLGVGESFIELGKLNIRNISIKAGTGLMFLDFTGFPSARKLDIETGAGKSTIDLSGKWKQNLKVYITCGVGKTRLILPEKTGTIIRIRQGIGSVKAKGFQETEKDIYKNRSFNKTKTSLDISVKAGIGQVELLNK